MENQQPARRNVTKKYAVLMVIAWTLLIFAFLSWNTRIVHENHLEKARIEARTFYNLNLAYRHWAAVHGGVYVPVTGTFRPNPYLQVPERDVTTTSGKKLTLINPAWMTRQVLDILRADSPESVTGRLVSLKFINPANKPDAWETGALHSFENGQREIDTVATIEGKSFLRLIRPFFIEPPCLQCHAKQGYRVGDIRGGFSMMIPLASHLHAETHEQRALLMSLIFIWIIGSGGIMLFYRRVIRHEHRIIQSEEKYRVLFENNPHPMWVYDLETLRFLAVNEAAVGHYGYAHGEFLAMSVKDLHPPEDIGTFLSGIGRVTTGMDKAGIWRHVRKDGSLIQAEITSHTVDFAGRRAELVLANDVTDRLKLEEQLRQAQKMEAVGLLAGGVAHDFNNVLTAIIGYGNLLHMKLAQDDPLRSYADNILSTAQRAAQLTQSLLAFGRKQVINPSPVELNSIVQRIAKLLQRLIREDIELRIALTDGNTMIMADSVQIEQVLMNLATNARDAMPHGGTLTIATSIVTLQRELIVSHGTVAPGRHVILSVSDTGIGMDERTRERLFEPFFTTKEMGKGTGLGLATTYGVVTQHRGTVDVESEIDKGTIFRFYFPLVKTQSQHQQANSPHAVPSGKETILVAEDDEMLRNLARSVLTEFGYTVVEAQDGEEAVEIFGAEPDRYDLLLFDVIMPRKNGKDALDEIRGIRPDVRAVFMSGYSADIISKEGILDQGIDVVTKPVSPVELLQKLRRVLDR
jgi:PAS domain S-box-containing protein